MGGLRIQRRLLGAFLALLACVILPAAVMLDRWLSADVRDLFRESLVREARVLSSELDPEHSSAAELQTWVHRFDGPGAPRISLIALGGEVLADTEVSPSSLGQLENHANRPEVVEALAGRTGSSVRHSATLGRDMMYVAMPVGAPPRLVLRVALPLTQVAQTVESAHTAIWVAGLLALLLALLLGSAFARWLSRPVLAMTSAARAMSRGDFGVSLPEASEDELGDLIRSLETLRSQLAARIEELRNEGVKLRSILNGMTEGVALVQGGAIAVANPAFSSLLGIVRSISIEGRTPLEAARVPELAEVIERASRDRTEASREVQVGGRALMMAAHPLGNLPANPVVVVLLDTTESKRLERLRRDFVANASHELRTPVAAIVGVAETLAAGASEDPEARASFLDILLRHAQRLSRLTGDLLDIARIEGGYRPRVESVPVAAAVEAVLATLRPRAEQKKIELSSSGTTDLLLASERAAVEQILTNLVDNAIKYTPENGSVKIHAESRGTLIQLTVEDTGPGIPEEHLPRLWERFYRVDNARSRELGGTGLGLSIVKHLVLANRGDIRVESTVGKGSRFIVSLPRL